MRKWQQRDIKWQTRGLVADKSNLWDSDYCFILYAKFLSIFQCQNTFENNGPDLSCLLWASLLSFQLQWIKCCFLPLIQSWSHWYHSWEFCAIVRKERIYFLLVFHDVQSERNIKCTLLHLILYFIKSSNFEIPKGMEYQHLINDKVIILLKSAYLQTA